MPRYAIQMKGREEPDWSKGEIVHENNNLEFAKRKLSVLVHRSWSGGLRLNYRLMRGTGETYSPLFKDEDV